jgi:hypothetical protein
VVSMNAEIQQTLAAYKAAVLNDPKALLQADAAKAWNVASGLQTYNLEALHAMFPQLTPVRNVTSRVKGKGKRVEYKAITAINTGGLSGFVAEGTAASLVATNVVDSTATYRSFALGDSVTMESEWAGNQFVDLKALAVTNLLRATMIAEENAILFGQNSAASAQEQAPGAVGAAATLLTADVTPSTTGGAIPTGTTYAVKMTVITPTGESLPSAVEKTFTIASGTTGSVALKPIFPSGQPVIGFNFYVGATGGPYYQVQAANVAAGLPTSAILPGGSATWATNGDTVTVTGLPANTQPTPPVADSSASSLAFNGIYTQMWGGSGATLVNQGGALTSTGITGLLKSLWNSGRADPDACWCNVQESVKLTNLTLGAGTPYQVLVNQGEVNNATANFRVARFTNPATGTELPVRVHPTVPQGLMLFLSSKLPGWYVPTDIPTVWEMDLPQDYTEIDYPPISSNPVWQVEVRFYGALKLYLPAIQGALYGINNG